jgi:hypothetical protein
VASVKVLVGAKSQQVTRTGELHLWVSNVLEDLDCVRDAAIEVTKRIVSGDLPLGARELL